MNSKHLKITGVFTLLWMLIALVAVTAATYAWFTFAPYTNVTPMTGVVGRGDGNLLISETRGGPFSVTCQIHPAGGMLRPVSTPDLESFYAAVGHDAAGISILYRDAAGYVDDAILHGTVYLKSDAAAHEVYLDRDGLYFGSDPQALAALRLGLKLYTAAGIRAYIFRLDDMGDTRSAAAMQTVPAADTVVSTVNGSGEAFYRADPAWDMGDYFIQKTENDAQPGLISLCSLGVDEVAAVEYWLYLEGCDVNCINDVQARDLSLQLAFSGIASQR